MINEIWMSHRRGKKIIAITKIGKFHCYFLFLGSYAVAATNLLLSESLSFLGDGDCYLTFELSDFVAFCDCYSNDCSS